MAETCIHCGDWIGRTATDEPKHREHCPLHEEPLVSAEERLAERQFMEGYIRDSLYKIAKPFAAQLNTPQAREALAGELNGFLDSLRSDRVIHLAIQITDPVDVSKDGHG